MDGKMDNVLTIVGSRREGNSLYLAKEVKKLFDKKEVLSDIIVPGKQRINYCNGCLECDITGKCVFDDEMTMNIELVKEAEMLVFISPTRWGLLSGDLKVFMDRLNPLAMQGVLKGKKSIIITIGQMDKEDESIENAAKSIRMFCENAGINVISIYKFYNCLNKDDMKKDSSEIDKMIKEIDKGV